MLKLVQAINSLLMTLVFVGVLAVLGFAGWFVYENMYLMPSRMQTQLQRQQAKLQQLQDQLEAKQELLMHMQEKLTQAETTVSKLKVELAAKEREIERLKTANRLLKIDRRVALIDVVSQEGSAEDGTLKTTFRFVELDPAGRPIGKPRLFTVDGDLVYIDAWVVKFDDELVESGDPLRGASLCLLKRIFGENQQPKEGVAIDQEGSRPAVYRSNDPMSEFEQEIWKEFWQLANDRQKAASKGIRAAHGVAPAMKLVAGKRYRLELRNTGQLTFVCEGDIPASLGEAY